ncbi:MAG: acyl-ACP--UDP-N-acetylglucosamine O-acyltransferase [Bacteroidales bacterium]
MKQVINVIHPEAILGKDVIVESFSTVAADVVIGEGTWIGPNVTIMDGARIGRNCRIFPGAVISAIPQDLKFQGEKTTAEIGDSTTIRECVTVNRGTAAKGKTVVGSNSMLMAYVHVAHDCVVGNNCILVNSVALAGEVEIGDFAIIGGMTAVHQFCKIGTHSMVGGASRVRKDVPPYIRASREPLQYVGINAIGLRRRNFSNDTIYMIQDILRVLYQKGLNISQALEQILNEFPANRERDIIVDFIRSSSRGIIKGYDQAKGKPDEDDF